MKRSRYNTKKVFVALSSCDKELVDPIIKQFRQLGVNHWIYTGEMIPGQTIDSQVVTQIKKCHAFILIVSDETMNSNWVQRELGYAVQFRKSIIPVIIRPCTSNTYVKLKEVVGDIVHVNYYTHLSDPTEDFAAILKGIEASQGVFGGINIRAMMFIIILLCIIVPVIFAFTEQRKMTTIEMFQNRIQSMDSLFYSDKVQRDRDTVDLIVKYYLGNSMVGKDEFSKKDSLLVTRSFYNEKGERIARDEFIYEADSLPERKKRTHFNADGDAFIVEFFSRTGKLQQKLYDRDHNGTFVEKEADFISVLPPILFPMPYR